MNLKIGNGYAGIGGNCKLWDYDVTSIELNPKIAALNQKLNPKHKVLIADAHEFLKNHFREFNFWWGSPMCQSHSKMMKFTRHDIAKYPDFRLYEEIVFLEHFFNGFWVVENVVPYYEPLIKPTIKIGRHLFWSNFEITPIEIKKPKNFINSTNMEGKKALMDWLDIHFEENVYYEGNHCPAQILRNAVHPLIGKHILDCAIKNGFKK